MGAIRRIWGISQMRCFHFRDFAEREYEGENTSGSNS